MSLLFLLELVKICTVLGEIMPPKDVQVLLPGTWEYVTLCGKVNQEANWLTLTQGDYPGEREGWKFSVRVMRCEETSTSQCCF